MQTVTYQKKILHTVSHRNQFRDWSEVAFDWEEVFRIPFVFINAQSKPIDRHWQTLHADVCKYLMMFIYDWILFLMLVALRISQYWLKPLLCLLCKEETELRRILILKVKQHLQYVIASFFYHRMQHSLSEALFMHLPFIYCVNAALFWFGYAYWSFFFWICFWDCVCRTMLL